MPDEKPRTNLRQTKHWQKEAARREYLRHPTYSISEVAAAVGASVRTVARARAALVAEGLLPEGRNAATRAADAMALSAAGLGTVAADPPSEPESAPPTETAKTIDGEAVRSMNEMLDALADEDDDVTRKKLMRQVKRFIFDPDLHPDTRMAASTLWTKLQDIQRAKDSGPGVPLTYADAKRRAVEQLRVWGAKLAVEAFYEAYDLGEVPRAEQVAPAIDPPQAAPPA